MTYIFLMTQKVLSNNIHVNCGLIIISHVIFEVPSIAIYQMIRKTVLDPAGKVPGSFYNSLTVQWS